MAAGIAALELLDEERPYDRLDRLGRQVRDALADACRAKGLPAQVPQTGSMFSLFFTAEPVRDYAGALRTDAALFARFFRGCLEQGVYLPPSAYETAFLSTAHEGAAIDRACTVVQTVIHRL
jgi:glutamate-1-semialdehyde 2,1-aminomutase